MTRLSSGHGYVHVTWLELCIFQHERGHLGQYGAYAELNKQERQTALYLFMTWSFLHKK